MTLHKFNVVALFVLTLIFVSVVTAQTHASHPWAETDFYYLIYNPDFSNSSAYGMLTVWTEGSANDMKVHLQYFHNIWDQNAGMWVGQSFQGIIPNSSLTYSGKPKFNGGTYTVSLKVDTSTIENSADVSKVGSGGWIDITWTQKPMGWVSTQVGPYTWEDMLSIFKQTGKLTRVESTVKGQFLGAQLQVPIPPPNGYYDVYSQLEYTSATTFTHTKK